MTTLVDALHRRSDLTAIIIPSELSPISRSFSQLHKDVCDVRALLAKLNIWHGMIVGVALPNSYEFIVSFLAIASQGAIAAPFNPGSSRSEVSILVEDMNPSLIIIPRSSYKNGASIALAVRMFGVTIAECFWDGSEVRFDLKEGGERLETENTGAKERIVQSNDAALILQTSGTTGRPKMVPLTHRNLLQSITNIRRTYGLSASDRTYLVMPLFHIHGLVAGLLSPLASACSVIVAPRFSAQRFWEDFITHGANWYTAVPTIHQILLKCRVPSPLPRIRFIRSCSSPLSPNTMMQLQETFRAPVIEAYAMTEAAHQICSNPLSGPQIPGSVGLAQGVELQILDEQGNAVPLNYDGEICIRGKNVTKGYRNNDAANSSAFTKSGFFRTGDQGKVDENGYVFITGRIKELINKGGEKISPVELDNVLTRHPAVSEVVSFAVEDAIYGQEVGVGIVLKPGHEVTEEEIRRWLQARVSKFKTPKTIVFTDAIPKTASGKIQRGHVAMALLADRQREVKL